MDMAFLPAWAVLLCPSNGYGIFTSMSSTSASKPWIWHFYQHEQYFCVQAMDMAFLPAWAVLLCPSHGYGIFTSMSSTSVSKQWIWHFYQHEQYFCVQAMDMAFLPAWAVLLCPSHGYGIFTSMSSTSASKQWIWLPMSGNFNKRTDAGAAKSKNPNYIKLQQKMTHHADVSLPLHGMRMRIATRYVKR